ncbi:DUF4344 domain-containing metallopeptidase [Nonomuraea recticatena]|uniref:DUF4344 domain-containing metallopeptidase n=1 Tax=Nonomuraea recticatena TaxID=46178 RepID=UPI0031F7DD8D
MRPRPLVAVVLAVVLAGCGTTQPTRETPVTPTVTTAAPATPTPTPSATGTFAFVPSYETPRDKALLPTEKKMRENRLVEKWAEAANDGFVPPQNIPVIAKQCDTANAFYDEEERTLTMCYEMADYLAELFSKPAKGEEKPTAQEVGEHVVGALNGIYFHELGHALIDLYDLPTTGKEEDAVDQLSALVLITEAEDDKDYGSIISTIEAWGRMSKETETGPLEQDDFAGDHSLSGQRYYNVMCYLYGSNHNAFLPLVADGSLPVERAMRCEQEYAKMARAWATLLGPHLREEPPSLTPSAVPTSTPSVRPPGEAQSRARGAVSSRPPAMASVDRTGAPPGAKP